jgi:GNAT superfamily N-acetyltransferase
MLTSSTNISHLDCTCDDDTDTEKINEFIHKHALNHQNGKLGFTHIISYEGTPIGYVTISASNIPRKKMTTGSRPRTNLSEPFPYPAVIIAYLAIDKKQRSKGFANYLLFLLIGYCRKIIAERVAFRFLILNAKEKIIPFYTRNGFQVALTQENEHYKLMYIDLFPDYNIEERSAGITRVISNKNKKVRHKRTMTAIRASKNNQFVPSTES